jgi:hypothetical protein
MGNGSWVTGPARKALLLYIRPRAVNSSSARRLSVQRRRDRTQAQKLERLVFDRDLVCEPVVFTDGKGACVGSGSFDC